MIEVSASEGVEVPAFLPVGDAGVISDGAESTGWVNSFSDRLFPLPTDVSSCVP